MATAPPARDTPAPTPATRPRLAPAAPPGAPAPAHSFKIVVTGPVGAGKTTFIRTISEITTVSTEAPITDGTAMGPKTTTTVGIDFGRLTVGGDLGLYLFGTPGQRRFDFMWDIAAKGMLGYILLLDCERPDTYPEAAEILRRFRELADVPAIVAANKVVDFDAEHGRIVDALGLAETDFVVPTDALDRDAVKRTLVELLELVVASLV